MKRDGLLTTMLRSLELVFCGPFRYAGLVLSVILFAFGFVSLFVRRLDTADSFPVWWWPPWLLFFAVGVPTAIAFRRAENDGGKTTVHPNGQDLKTYMGQAEDCREGVEEKPLPGEE